MLVSDLNEWGFCTYVSAKMAPIIRTDVLCSFKYYHDLMDISHILSHLGMLELSGGIGGHSPAKSHPHIPYKPPQLRPGSPACPEFALKIWRR